MACKSARCHHDAVGSRSTLAAKHSSNRPAVKVAIGSIRPEKTTTCSDASCSQCRADQRYLRGAKRPVKALGTRDDLRAVDLFAGCGGMTLGLEEAARRHGLGLKVALAVESDPEVGEIYKLNQPDAKLQAVDAAGLFPGGPGTQLSEAANNLREQVGECDILLGGPPCQGHSDLNNHTRRTDPKNGLYLAMARAAEILKPKVVIVENVAPVQWDKERVVDRTKEALESAGYTVEGRVIDLRRVGVPQRRRRYLLIGSRIGALDPKQVLDSLDTSLANHFGRNLQWAIGDLLDLKADSIFDTASQASANNVERMAYLFTAKVYNLPNELRPDCHKDGKHSYKSMYGRLKWTEPAQTITTGFGSMGQGRYVHPSKRRTITPHEAARLQTFPDWFDFGRETRRGVLAKIIGNAVPPLLMVQLGTLIVPAIIAARSPSHSDPHGSNGSGEGHQVPIKT